MQVEEAKILLGFPPGSRPDPSQVKAAYREKVWESHPDRFPADQKLGSRGGYYRTGVYSRVVRTGVPRPHAGKGNPRLIGIPFLLIVLGTVGLGGFKATRAYKQQKQAFPSHNPFLP